MALSKGKEQTIVEKTTLYKGRHFKKLVESTKTVMTKDPTAGILGFMVFVSGLAGLIGQKMGVAWYAVLFLILGLFAVKQYLEWSKPAEIYKLAEPQKPPTNE